MKPAAAGKYIHLKFTERYGKGKNIDVGRIAFVGYEGKHASAVASTTTAVAAKAKGFVSDWATAFAQGDDKKDELSDEDAALLTELGVLRSRIERKVPFFFFYYYYYYYYYYYFQCASSSFSYPSFPYL